MRGHPKQIDQAQLELASIVSHDLSGHGWVQRDLDRHSIAVLTRDTGNGVMATAELFRTSFQWPEDWPIEVGVRIGVGYEPALNLMPLLTLDPDVALLAADRQQSRPGFTVTLGDVGDVAAAARNIVAVITDQAVPFARRFADAAAIDAALSERHRRRRRPASTDTPHDGADVDDFNNGDSDHHTEQRLLLLAAMGRHDETRTLLTTYPSRHGDEPIDRDDRRFIRQLTRWLDADGPSAPRSRTRWRNCPANPDRRGRPGRPPERRPDSTAKPATQ